MTRAGLVFSGFIAALSLSLAQAQAQTFASPSGLTEECKVLPHIPGGDYAKSDVHAEQEFCGLDFYASTKIALCPKTWSTSPGTMVYDISESGKSQRDYEAQASCGGSKAGHKDFGKFKQTMNEKGTSGTYSPSALLYYHLSRFFDTSVSVPVAVYRTMDKSTHFSRVTNRAVGLKMGKSAQNRAGWAWLAAGEKSPGTYAHKLDLFTADQKQIYGALVGGGGTRYGTEINGVRSKWGVVQNQEFQLTPAFLALSSQQALPMAIQEGLKSGRKDKQINRDLGADVSELQMAVWMKELTEIVLLDYIFSQQDRVGNIDFKWMQYTVGSDGEVSASRLRIDGQRAGQTINENQIQVTQINDNDAGGIESEVGSKDVGYVNFTKKTQMLNKIHHLSVKTYKKLLVLDQDLQGQGEIYQYLATNFNWKPNYLNKAVKNVNEAMQIFKGTCKAGQMHFDLFTAKAILKGHAQESAVNCEAP